MHIAHLLVGVSRVSSRRLVCRVSKTGFCSSAVVFLGTIKDVWYYLVLSHRLVCRGSLKNCRRLKTTKNWTPHTSRRKVYCGNLCSIVASVGLQKSTKDPDSNKELINEIPVIILQKIFSVLIFVDRF